MQIRFEPSKNDLIDPEFSTVLVGQSVSLREAIHKARCIAEDPATVLILGESGTGKEEMARGIHRLSHRPGPFIAVNCAALPAELAESLLFGHVRGAFTTADRDELGLIRQSQHGTLFLDEVGELEMKLQSKLLRVLQERAVLPIGGKSEIPVDFRVVAATNRDLRAMVHSGQFREDLHSRLSEWTIILPPFRVRGRDPLLVLNIFLEQEARKRHQRSRNLTPAAEAVLLQHPWLTNGRELQRVAKALVVGKGDAPISVAEARAVLGVNGSEPVDDELKRALKLRIGRGDGPTRAQLCHDLERGKSAVCGALNVLILSGTVYRYPDGRTPRYFMMPGRDSELAPAAATQSGPVPANGWPTMSTPLDEATSNDERILRMAARGRVTTKAVAAELKCSRKTASRLLTGLKNSGQLVERGRGSAIRYERRRP